MSGETSLKVVVRARPINSREAREAARRCVEFYEDSNQIVINKALTFAFDAIFNDTADQGTVYEKSAATLLDHLFSGFNGTIIAYGQTGSGKTYTMGTEDKAETDPVQRGIIPRLVDDIFGRIASSGHPDTFTVIKLGRLENADFLIMVSMYEIYGDAIYDLLRADKVKLDIRGDEHGCTISNLTSVPVKTLAETLKQLALGCHYRVKAETAMNATSSRSHAVFNVAIEKTPADDEDISFTSKLQLVDLAGSERLKKTQAEGDRMREGISINSGLLAIGNVISALVQKQRHVPYRSSVLTRVLQDSLGGNAVTVMVACISPADTNSDESLNTLRYADRAKQIKNKPIINQNPKAEEVASLRAQIRVLQRENSELKAGGTSANLGLPVAANNSQEYFRLKEDLQSREVQLRERGLKLADTIVKNNGLTSKAERLEEEKERINQLLSEFKANIEKAGAEDTGDVFALANDLITAWENFEESPEFVETIDENVDETIEDFDHARLADLQTEMDALDREIELKDAGVRQSAKEQEVFNQALQKREEEKAQLVVRCQELETEISKLKLEQRKISATSKIAEERRIKLKELEKKCEEDKRKLMELKKLQELRKKGEEAQKKMEEELKQLKQTRGKLLKEQRAEAARFKLFKEKHERELQQVKTKAQKREFEVARQKRVDDQRFAVLQQRLADSTKTNKMLKDLLLRGEKRTNKGASDFTALIEEQLEIVSTSHRSQLLMEDLQKQRAELQRQCRAVDEKGFGEGATPSKKAKYSDQANGVDAEAFDKKRREKLDKLQNSIDIVNVELAELKRNSTILENSSGSGTKWAHVKFSTESKAAFDALMMQTNFYVKKLVDLEVKLEKQKAQYEQRLSKMAEEEGAARVEKQVCTERMRNLAEEVELTKKDCWQRITASLALINAENIDRACLQQFEELKDHFADVEKQVKKFNRRRTTHLVDGITPKPELNRADRVRKQTNFFGKPISFNLDGHDPNLTVDQKSSELIEKRIPMSPIGFDEQDELLDENSPQVAANTTFVISDKSEHKEMRIADNDDGADEESIPPLKPKNKSRTSHLGPF